MELPVQRLHSWNACYLGLQHLQALLLGLVLYAYGADEEALNELAAVRIDITGNAAPDTAVAAAALLSGNLHIMREAWSAAATAYSAATAVPELQPAAMVNLGVLYALQGEAVHALDQLALAVQQAPELALAHHNLAVLQQRVDRLDEAEAHFRLRPRPELYCAEPV